MNIETQDRAGAGAKAGGLSGATLAAICCLGLILLLVASTIVLALIPVYLPKKTASFTNNALSRKLLTFNQNSGIPPYGPTTPSACQTISDSIATTAGLSTSAMRPVSCSFGTPSGRRRRRLAPSHRRRRQSQVVVLYMIVDFVLNVCPLCVFETFLVKFVGLVFTSSFEYYGSRSVTFVLINISQETTAENLVTESPTTTTTASSATAVTTAATTPSVSNSLPG